jgi:hypothetical protein
LNVGIYVDLWEPAAAAAAMSFVVAAALRRASVAEAEVG